MHLAFCGTTALVLTRAVRSGLAGQMTIGVREPLCTPDPGKGRSRFTRKLLEDVRVRGAYPLPLDRPLCIAAPSRKVRPQSKLFSCTVYEHRAPACSFVSLGEGLQMSCPELLFIEMAATMPFFNLVLLGCELCGTYVRDPHDPVEGEVVYHTPPVTNVQNMREFARSRNNLPGLVRARKALAYVMDNAWSPMEAVVATMANLPANRFGYGLGPVVLNKRLEVSASAARDSRVPDMLLGGTKTGLNYDGGNHLDLGSVVDQAVKMALDPGNEGSSEALNQSVRAVREKFVDDRRRDRELLASGHSVLVVTYEDLVERGGLDRVMALAMDSMEQEGDIDLTEQRTWLGLEFLRRRRQELVWSCLPGELGAEARRLRASRLRRSQGRR